MSHDMKRNVLHDYIDLLRGKKRDEAGKALHNIIRTMSLSRHQKICGENFTELDFGIIPFNGIHFSLEGKYPCCFDGSQLDELSFRNTLMSGPVTVVALSNDHRYALTCNNCETAIIWDVYSGTIQSILRGHTKKIRCAAFSPDGRFCITGSDDCTARIWRVESGSCRISIPLPSGKNVTAVAFSLKHGKIMVCSEERLWIWEKEGEYDRISDENRKTILMTWLLQKSIHATPNKPKNEWNGRSDFFWHYPIDSNDIRPLCHCSELALAHNYFEDDSSFGWLSYDNYLIKVQENPDGSTRIAKKIRIPSSDAVRTGLEPFLLIKRLTSSLQNSRWLLISPHGKTCMTLNEKEKNKLFLWRLDLPKSRIKATLTGHSDSIESTSFSVDEQCCISGSDDQTAIVWNTDNGKPERIFSGHSHSVILHQSFDNGTMIFRSSHDFLFWIYDADTKALHSISLPENPDTNQRIWFSDKGTYIVFPNKKSGQYELWNIVENKLIRPLQSFRLDKKIHFHSKIIFFPK